MAHTPKGFGQGGGQERSPSSANQPIGEMIDSGSTHPLGGAISAIKPNPISGFYTLHVKSIPMKWTETILKNVFLKVGKVMSIHIGKPTPGKNLKWAFVDYPTFQEAEAAIKYFHKNVIFDNIEVSFSNKNISIVQENAIYDMNDQLCEEDWDLPS